MRYERDGYSVKSAKKKRRPLPPWYLDEPDPLPQFQFFFDAFRDLLTCRPTDGPIPWTAAMAYADRKRLAPDVADALWTVINVLDLTERRWTSEQVKAEIGSGN